MAGFNVNALLNADQMAANASQGGQTGVGTPTGGRAALPPGVGGSTGSGGGGSTGGSTGGGGGTVPPPPGAYTAANGVTFVNGVPWNSSNPMYNAMSQPNSGMAAAPTQYSWNQQTANSIDPGVYGQNGFAQGQNADLLMSQTNNQNNLAYGNYQNAYNNWLQNGAQGPPPQAPNYAQFNQGQFNNLWNQDVSQGGGQAFANLNSAITPGSVFANNPGTNPGYYAGGPGGTYSTPQAPQLSNPYSTPQQILGSQQGGQQPQQQNNQGFVTGGPANYGGYGGGQQFANMQAPQGFSGGFAPQGQGGLPNGMVGGGSTPGFGGTNYAGQNAAGGQGTQFGGFNGWGAPYQGNPYAYMTGQANNGLGNMQFNIPQGGGFGNILASMFSSTGGAPGMFSQQPLSFGYGNMNPLNGSGGSLGGLLQLFNNMFGI